MATLAVLGSSTPYDRGIVAQEADPERQSRLEARLDSLLDEWEDLGDLHFRSTVDASDWTSSEVQGFTLITTGEESAEATRALEAAVRDLPEWSLDHRTASSHQGLPTLVLAPAREALPAGMVEGPSVVVRPTRWVWNLDARIQKALERALADGLPQDVKAWSGMISLSTRPDARAGYRALVGSGLSAAHACFDGEMEGCRDALGLGAPIGSSADIDVVPGPARYGVLRTALDMGGTGAYARLVETYTVSEPGLWDVAVLESRLEAAAGQPVDSIIATWRRTVLTDGLGRRSDDVQQGLAGLLIWLSLMTVCVSRSTRWRVR